MNLLLCKVTFSHLVVARPVALGAVRDLVENGGDYEEYIISLYSEPACFKCSVDPQIPGSASASALGAATGAASGAGIAAAEAMAAKVAMARIWENCIFLLDLLGFEALE